MSGKISGFELKRCFLFVGLLLLAGSGIRAAEGFELERVRVSSVQEGLLAHAERGFSGAVRVVQSGQTVFSGAAGLRDYANPARGRIEPVDHFPIGSVTKQFTAAAILHLEEQGLLAMDAPLVRYLPDAPWSSDVTLKQLLNHTAGTPNYTEFQPIQQMVARPWAIAEIFQLLLGRSLEFAPGSQWNYSNTGYFLLGEVVRKLTGKAWDIYLRDEFFLPLGMNDTFALDEVALPEGGAGFDQNRRFEPEPTATRYLSWAHAAGALVSTTLDLARWNAALHGGQLLSGAQYARMIEPGLAHYGLGLIHAEVPMGGRSVEVIGHSGGLPGFYSKNYIYPDQKLEVIVLSNFTNNEDANLAQTLAEVAVTGQSEVVRVPVALPLDVEFARSVVGGYRFREMPARAWVRADENGELWFQVEGQEDYLIKRIAPDVLYLRFDDVTIQLERNAAGEVLGFELTQGQQRFHAVRTVGE